jgi:hypothetical protein
VIRTSATVRLGPHASAHDRLFVIATLVGIGILLAQLIDFGYGRDQGIYAAVGDVMVRGGVPYRDAWDFKPPGIFFVFAAARLLLGSSVHAVRIIEAAALALTCVAFVRLARAWLGDGRAGLVGSLIATLVYVQLDFWHTAQPESFGLTAVAWGLVAAEAATRDDRSLTAAQRRWRATAAGLAFGTAAVFKPTVGIAGLAPFFLMVAAALRGPGHPVRLSWLDGAGPMVFGGLTPVVGCLVYFAARSASADLVEALFVFAPQYAATGWVGSGLMENAWRALAAWSIGFSLLLPVGVALAFTGRGEQRERAGLALVGACIVLLLGGVIAQAKFFPYHFGTVVPLTGFVAGCGFWRLWTRVRSRATGVACFVGLVVALALASPTTPRFLSRCGERLRAWQDAAARTAIRDRLYSDADYDANSNRAVTAWLRDHTAPSDAVFVWGFTPELYVTSGRRPASRYIYDVPQRAPWSATTARDGLMRDLALTPPAAIVVEKGDVMPLVTGATRDSAEDLRTFEPLRTLMASRYRLVRRLVKFDVYVREVVAR